MSSNEDSFDNLEHTERTTDQDMSGTNLTSPTLDLGRSHSPSAMPDKAHQQNMSTPVPKREESEGVVFPETPRVFFEDGLGAMDPFTPGAGMTRPLASPINFDMFAENSTQQTPGKSARLRGSMFPSSWAQDPTPESNLPVPANRSPSPVAREDLGTQVEQLAIDDDDDDDTVMINREDGTSEAQNRWAEPRSRATTTDSIIKQEPKALAEIRNPTPPPAKPINFQQMMVVQRAMLQNTIQKEKANASLFGPRDSVEAESSHRHRPSFAQIGDEHENARAAMGDEDEDHSWMHDDGSSQDEEYENLVATRSALERRARNGKITEEQQLELYNIKKRLQSIQSKDKMRKRAAGRRDDDEGLFVPEEDRTDVVERHIRDRPTKSTFAHGTKTKGKPRKKATGKRPQNAREFHEQEAAKREKERAKAQKKKTPAEKAGGRKTPPPKGKGKGKGKAKGKAPQRSRVTTRSESLLRPNNKPFPGDTSDQGDPIAQTILDDLMFHDPVRDRLENPHLQRRP